jgi:hypothetical protein
VALLREWRIGTTDEEERQKWIDFKEMTRATFAEDAAAIRRIHEERVMDAYRRRIAAGSREAGGRAVAAAWRCASTASPPDTRRKPQETVRPPRHPRWDASRPDPSEETREQMIAPIVAGLRPHRVEGPA